ncbi:hydrophobic surface binding protein [Agrocybe pediades]|nr:hydrophobic surface binding protein [Agrocybe pediades]
MKFPASLIILSSLVSAALSATVADVIADTHNIVAQTNTLDSVITSFPNTGGSLTAALSIHSGAVSLGSTIDRGTADIISAHKPVSQADGTTILSVVQTFENAIVRTLSDIVAKKATFAALPIGGIPALVLQDLINLRNSVFKFETQLIGYVPSKLVAPANKMLAPINDAFARAIAVYS